MKVSELYRVIEEYDEGTFVACRDTLYRPLGFCVIPKEEVRRIDMKEKLAALCARDGSIQSAEGDFDKTLASFVERAIEEHFAFTSERARKYHARVETCCSIIEQGTADLSTIEDMILIYISFFSVYRTYFYKQFEESVLEEGAFKYHIDRDSLDVASFIRDNIKISGRKQIKALKNKFSLTSKTFTEQERETAFIITVLFIYRILQFEGEM